jgi:hypothetical protein
VQKRAAQKPIYTSETIVIKAVHRTNYDRAMRGRSPKAAIKAHCLECVCWQKEEVRLCSSPACALFPYRPYRISK